MVDAVVRGESEGEMEFSEWKGRWAPGGLDSNTQTHLRCKWRCGVEVVMGGEARAADKRLLDGQ
jgi:hypothetical protein